ncbi:MAG: hypothetical protein PHN88_09545 [Ignavibacteria bacterium]|nr:hypothetical protein [Ignavibacteria bacterium]
MYWITKYNLFFITLVILSANTFFLSAQINSDYYYRNISCTKDTGIYKSPPANTAPKFSIAFLPTILVREDQAHSNYSTGYGFNIESSYEVSNYIKISGSIEAIFAHFEMHGMESRNVYETTSNWYSL